ncbi:MAG TPA: PspC domain-containing protein [Verrucomicrobiae bacterium]|nr:PspC domain-containing protein [Verrucomicrobiae bacterium]
MNEITKIHLGRTAFTIAIDAHKQLRHYLDAIKRHVGPKHEEVLEEVELRMAELLTERGVTADKVVVAKDVEFLKEQLGSPSDFEDDDEKPSKKHQAEDYPSRRLLRDPRDQILGGVASGLGTYFGIDAWIFRAAFAALTFAGGSGFMIYALLWLLVPKAKTNSDFLQMKGKPVTIEALTDYVSSQDFEHDAKQAGNRIGQALSEMFRALVKLARYAIGTFLTVISLIAIIWTIGAGTYVLTSPERLLSAGRIFPIGAGETALVILVMAVALSALVLLLGSGVAFLRKKWPLPLWVSAALGTVFIVGAAVSVGLGAKFGPRIHDRYEAAHKTVTRQVGDFQTLEVSGDQAAVYYEYAATPSVDIRVIGEAKEDSVKTDLQNSTLSVNVSDIRSKGCDWFCIDNQDVSVTVRGPQLQKVTVHENAAFRSEKELHQENLTVVTKKDANLFLSHVHAKHVLLNTEGSPQDPSPTPDTRTLSITGITPGFPQDRVWMNGDAGFTITAADEFTFSSQQTCNLYESLAHLWQMPAKITINAQQFTDEKTLRMQQDDDERSSVNCVTIR